MEAMKYEYPLLRVYQYHFKLFSIIPSEIFSEIYIGKEIEEEWTTTDLEVIIKDQLYLQSELLEWNASKNIKH